MKTIRTSLRTAVAAVLTLLVSCPGRAPGAAGELDPGFNIAVSGSQAVVYATAVQPDAAECGRDARHKVRKFPGTCTAGTCTRPELARAQ